MIGSVAYHLALYGLLLWLWLALSGLRHWRGWLGTLLAPGAYIGFPGRCGCVTSVCRLLDRRGGMRCWARGTGVWEGLAGFALYGAP